MRLLGCLLALLFAVHLQAQEKTLSERGFVRDWLVAAPVPLGEKIGAAALDSDIAKRAAALMPRAGEKLEVGGKTLEWKAQTTGSGKLDFVAIIGAESPKTAAIAVTYIIAEAEMKGLLALTGSDDEMVLSVNGAEVSRFDKPRGFRTDEDVSQPLTLKQGVNTIVLFVVDEGGAFAGSLSFAHKTGSPLSNVKVSLTPPAK